VVRRLQRAGFSVTTDWPATQRALIEVFPHPATVRWFGLPRTIKYKRGPGAARRREPMGLDAAPGASWAQRKRPMVAVLVVGETTRAANWGLNGYGRQTTPELARLPVVNFTDVTACGTNTEVSLPCMFAPVGRRDHDEARIRGQQSLLHVLARAGVAVHWRDTQSGCKGVCEGLPGDTVASQRVPALCPEGERCLDEGLIHDLDARLDAASGTQLWVFHMLGNHGPNDFRRHPPRHAGSATPSPSPDAAARAIRPRHFFGRGKRHV
jgi:lipid A ethanolaminephosphotransferase